jgi:hypothetical protein
MFHFKLAAAVSMRCEENLGGRYQERLYMLLYYMVLGAGVLSFCTRVEHAGVRDVRVTLLKNGIRCKISPRWMLRLRARALSLSLSLRLVLSLMLPPPPPHSPM